MAIRYSASAPAGWGIDDTGHFVQVPSGYVRSGDTFVPAGQTSGQAVQPVVSTPSQTYSSPTVRPSTNFSVPAGMELIDTSSLARIQDGPNKGQLAGNLQQVFGNDYENIQTSPDGLQAYGYRIPKATLISPSGQRVVVRTDNKTGGYPPAAEYLKSGFVPEKAPGIPAVPGNILGQSTASGASGIDLADRPMLELPSGQRISNQDPNYSLYSQLPGVKFIETVKPVTSQPNQSGTSSSASAAGIQVDQTGWTDSMRQSFDALAGYIETIQKQGKVINPDIKIDDVTVQRFLEQAKTELGPYYRQAFDQTAADLKTALERTKAEFAQREQDLSRSFGRDLEQTQQSFADRGLTFSTQRTKAEQDLSSDYSRALEDATTAAANKAKDIATQGERTLGSANLPSLDTSVRSGTTFDFNKPGQYTATLGTGSRSLFAPTTGTTGTLERAKLFDTEQRKGELINAERELRSVNYL